MGPGAPGGPLPVGVVRVAHLPPALPHTPLGAVGARLHQLRRHGGLGVGPRGPLHSLSAKGEGELALRAGRTTIRAWVRAAAELVVVLWLA